MTNFFYSVWGNEMIASFTDGRIAVFEVGDEDAVSLVSYSGMQKQIALYANI